MKEYLSSKEQVLSDLSAGEQGLSSAGSLFSPVPVWPQ